MRKFVVLLGALAGLLLAVTPLASARSDANGAREPVTIQVLSVSDWHAQLDPLTVGLRTVGGAAVLSTYFDQERAANPNTLIVTAGDSYGASPPLSSLFDEAPAVKAMNLMGFDVDTFGNHNFDRGVPHLQRMIDLAEFDYVTSNLSNLDANLQGAEEFQLYDLGGVTVGVVGIIDDEAPTLVFPGSFGTMTVQDAVSQANKARARAQAAGAEVTVALVHMGVEGFDAAGNPVGDLIDFADEVGGFDVIIGDHTDIQYAGVHNNALVVENKSRGATYAVTRLTVDPKNGRVIDREVTFKVPVSSAVTPDPEIVSMLAPYRSALAAAFDVKIGEAAGIFIRGSNVERLREVPIGNLVADAMRERYGTQIAFTNGGGLRAPLPSSYLPADRTLRRNSPGYAAGPPFDLVLGDAHTVLPFGNIVVTRMISGAQLWQALEHGVSSLPNATGRFLQVSGFKFTYALPAPVGSRVRSVTLDTGTPILPDATLYSVALPDFVNAGGDGFTMLADGQGVTRDLMADVLADHIRAKSVIVPATDGRIVQVP